MSQQPVWNSRADLERMVALAVVGLMQTPWPTREVHLVENSPVPDIILALPRFHAAMQESTVDSALATLFRQAFEQPGGASFGQAITPELIELAKKALGLVPWPWDNRSMFGMDRLASKVFYEPLQSLRYNPFDFGGEPKEKYIFAFGLIGALASWLCDGAPERYSGIPTARELANALDAVLVEGLPVTAETATDPLFAVLPHDPGALLHQTKEQLIGRADLFLRNQIGNFEIDDLREAAQILFAYAPRYKGTSLTRRLEAAATILEMSPKSLGEKRLGKGRTRGTICYRLAEQILKTIS